MIRLARIIGLLLPAAILAATLFAALQASAQEHSDSKFQPRYKVLGRGIENKKTGAVLQLACVDDATLDHPSRQRRLSRALDLVPKLSEPIRPNHIQ